VQGFDVDPKRMNPLQQQGGIPVDSAAGFGKARR